MIITLSNVKNSGWKMPLRAICIMPLDDSVPNSTPALAIMRIVRKEAAFEPTAELRKLTASLLTPTIKSAMARITRRAIMS